MHNFHLTEALVNHHLEELRAEASRTRATRKIKRAAWWRRPRRAPKRAVDDEPRFAKAACAIR
jgi:hypothetical protein